MSSIKTKPGGAAIIGTVASDMEPPMVEFKLPDMTCGHCAATVKRTVQALDASAQVDFDLPTHVVRIETSVEEGALRAALTEEGYAPAN
jgi:copper chaperone